MAYFVVVEIGLLQSSILDANGPKLLGQGHLQIAAGDNEEVGKAIFVRLAEQLQEIAKLFEENEKKEEEKVEMPKLIILSESYDKGDESNGAN